MVIAFAVTVFIGCGNIEKEMAHKIKDLEASTSADSANQVIALNTKYLEFQEAYPKNEKSPEFLFKAAQNNNYMGNNEEAIKLFEKFRATYPEDKKSADALFVVAFTYENNLNDLDKAKLAYEEFIAKYPDHALIKDAKFALQNLGKSPEEILSGFDMEE